MTVLSKPENMIDIPVYNNVDDAKKDGYKIFFGTHDGNFHCDEILATGLLLILHPDAAVIRTRNEVELAKCTIVYDVGAVFDFEKFRFDHHQKGFFETMENFQTKLSACGLIWKYFGKQIVSKLLSENQAQDEIIINKFYEKIYEVIIEHIDAIDNGIPLSKTPLNCPMESILSVRINKCNPSWNEDCSDDARNNCFKNAVNLAVSEFKTIVTEQVLIMDHMEIESQYTASDILADALVQCMGTTCETHVSTTESPSTLVWKNFGKKILNEKYPKLSDENIMLIYDKMSIYLHHINDDHLHIPISKTDFDFNISTSLNNRIKHMNGFHSKDELINLVLEEFFGYASKLVNSWLPSRDIIKEAFNNKKDPLILELDEYVPWTDIFEIEREYGKEGETLFVTFPDGKGGYRAQAVPIDVDSKVNRVSFSKSWCGTRGTDLEKISEIDGCVFVHANGFIAGNKTKDGVMSMINKTIYDTSVEEKVTEKMLPNKNLILVPGPPGAGKTTFTQKLMRFFESLKVSRNYHCTDDYFEKDGRYEFDFNELANNHKRNQDAVKLSMEQEVSFIIVPNTLLLKWEREQYEKLAREYGYSIHIAHPKAFSSQDNPIYKDGVFDKSVVIERRTKEDEMGKIIPLDVMNMMCERFIENDIFVSSFDLLFFSEINKL